MAKTIAVTMTLTHDRLPKLRGALRRRASLLVRKAALDIEAQAKMTVPVRTGNLKNSLRAVQESELSAVVGTAVVYAPYVEFGTTRMAPRPYLLPAAEAVRPAFLAAFERLFTEQGER